jgi:YegS/Rv2252/BmrU family lipid kinase
MTGFVVVNPRSGNGRTGHEWPQIERALRAVYPGLTVAFTRRTGDATTLVRHALREGHAEIIAVGGDGTINEAVNGFFDANGTIADDAVFAFVTSGTGGDFRRTFGIADGAAAAIESLANASIRRIDVGRMSCVGRTGEPVIRHFVNIASFGLSGIIVERVNRARIAKLFGGAFAFQFHSACAMLTRRDSIVRLRVDGSYDEIAGIATVAIANGQYFGAGMRVAPKALPDDGAFDVIVMGGGRNSLAELKLLYRGEHLERPGIRMVRGARVMAAPVAETGGHPIYIEVDGESAGRLPATFEIIPRALNLRC